MRNYFTLFLCLLIFKPGSAQFSYVNPTPGSKHRNPQTNIILKNSTCIDRESVEAKNLLEITGSKSGRHTWKARLSDDNKTVIVKPEHEFAWEETVTVNVNPALKNIEGVIIDGTTFQFEIRKEPTAFDIARDIEAKRLMLIEEYGFDPHSGTAEVRDIEDTAVVYPLDSMPTFTILVNNNPAPGQLFYANHQDQTGPEVPTNSFTTIIENDGTIIWAKDVGKEGRDFKINYNGYMSYFVGADEYWMIMDSNYNIIDSVTMGNGYKKATNNHDMVMYPDGHYFLIGYDNRTTDMTAYGGQPDATVQYLVLQELDANKDVVFEWLGEDPGHFLFTDANQWTSLQNLTVDYIHCNSVERDTDGNLLISCRNMDELTKINRTTGNIMWRMGGENNQFTFVNDNIAQHFASQHDLRRLDNGNIMLFNNGNKLNPQRSSAKEYALDEINKVATLIWYYEHPDVNGVKVYGSATGGAQRLPNGNTLIDWGLVPAGSQVPHHTEVDYNKNIVWEMRFDAGDQKTYRIHKYIWDPCSRPTSGLTKVKKIEATSAKVDWRPATGAISYEIQYRQKGNINWKSKTSAQSSKKLKGLKPDSVYVFRIRSVCGANEYSGWTEIDTFKTKHLRLELSADQISPSVELYPNPANDILNISIKYFTSEEFTLVITDVTGKTHQVVEGIVTSEDQTISADMTQLPRGIYFIEMKAGENRTVKKFIRQ